MNSHFCLNEMGAVWANNQSIYPIVIPPASYNILERSALRGVTNVLTIIDVNDLAKLRDEMVSKNLPSSDIRSAEYNLRSETFINVVNAYIQQRKDEGPLTVPVTEYMQLKKELDGFKEELRAKIEDGDAKDALIEQLKNLKDQTAVKKVIQAHQANDSNEWDQFMEILEDTKSTLSSLSNLIVSLLYHYRTFGHHYRPGTYEWGDITNLHARKFITHDEGEIYINEDHPELKKAIRLLDLLDDAIQGMSVEVYERFVEENNIEPDLSNSDFWSNVLEIRGLNLSNG